MLKLKLKKLNQIYKCDLSNKYVIKSLFQVPQITKVTLNLNIKDLSAFNASLGISVNEKEYKIKTFLILFFYFFSNPFYNLKYLLGVSRFVSETAKPYLQILSSQKSLVNEFMLNMFIENSSLLNNQNKNIFNKFLVTQSSNQNCKLLHFFLSAKSFENFDKIGLFVFNNNNIKQINFQMVCELSQLNSSLNIKKLVQNMPFFWING